MIRLAVDAGSRVTKIYMLGCGVVLAEATCVAVQSEDGEAVYKAFGDKARALSGRSAQNTHIINPVKEGDIDRPDLLAELLVYFFGKIEIKPSKIKKIEVLFILPCGFDEELKNKYADVAEMAGIGRVCYTSHPFAAVLGHNVPLSESTPAFSLDIGYGVTNVAVISLDGIISGFTINLGGGNIDVHLMDYVAENYHLRIGTQTAERLKETIGSLLEDDDKLMILDGRNTESGAPASISIRASQIYEVMKLYVDKILEYARLVLNKLPAEVSSSVIHGGVYLSGGMVKCDGLPEYIEKQLGIPAHVSEEPALSTVMGAGAILSSELLRSKVTLMD